MIIAIFNSHTVKADKQEKLCAYSFDMLINGPTVNQENTVLSGIKSITDYFKYKVYAIDIHYGSWDYITVVYSGKCNNSDLQYFNNLILSEKTIELSNSEIISIQDSELENLPKYDVIKLHQGKGRKAIVYDAKVRGINQNINANILEVNSYIQGNALPISAGSFQKINTEVNYYLYLYAGFDQQDKIIGQVIESFKEFYKTKDVMISLNDTIVTSN